MRVVNRFPEILLLNISGGDVSPETTFIYIYIIMWSCDHVKKCMLIWKRQWHYSITLCEKKSADKFKWVPSWGALVAARMVSYGLLPEQPIFWNATGRTATVVTDTFSQGSQSEGWQREYAQLKRSPLGCPRLLQRSFLWYLANLQVGSCPSVHLLASAPLFRQVGLKLP